jgi:nickel-dependent lactate racemase
MARHDFILDTALTRTREIAGVFAGHPVRAHAAGVQFVSEALLERLPEPADAVLTTAAGYPLDLTFYQAIKGVTAAQHIVKPGGRILLVAECAEGAGAPEFAQKLREFNSYGELLRQLAQTPVVVDQWQIEKLALAGEKYQIFFYVPGLPEDLRKGLGGRAYNRPQEAIAAFLDGIPKSAEIAVIPEGPYVYARVEEPVLA